MKKICLLAFLILAAAAAFALPCTDAWSECVGTNGYPDEGCDAGWERCMDVLYGP